MRIPGLAHCLVNEVPPAHHVCAESPAAHCLVDEDCSVSTLSWYNEDSQSAHCLVNEDSQSAHCLVNEDSQSAHCLVNEDSQSAHCLVNEDSQSAHCLVNEDSQLARCPVHHLIGWPGVLVTGAVPSCAATPQGPGRADLPEMWGCPSRVLTYVSDDHCVRSLEQRGQSQ